MHDAVSEALGEHVTPETDVATLRKLCDAATIPYRTHWDAGAIVLELYEHLVEDRTEAPTFYKDFPTSVSPLTRPHRSIPGVAERWDLVAWGVELGTAYSELTDPVEQRRRLEEQSLLASGGDHGPWSSTRTSCRPWVRHAADGWTGYGRRPRGHDDHRSQHPRDTPVPLAKPR